jgi:hypothetical protein
MPVIRLVLITLLLAAATGCGGEEAGKPDDPGRATLGAFLRAAVEGDTDLMRGLLSLESNRRVGTPELSRLARKLRPLARRYRLLVSERITDDFGITAVTGPSGVYAAALRREGEEWRLELAGPVRIKPLGPVPGARQALVQQIAAEIEGGSGGGDALFYLDGTAVPFTKTYTAASAFTAFANLPSPVRRGRHSIVAFAHRGGSASALAWAFSVSG